MSDSKRFSGLYTIVYLMCFGLVDISRENLVYSDFYEPNIHTRNEGTIEIDSKPENFNSKVISSTVRN